MRTESIRLSIVVPCYNEEAVLEECARRLRDTIQSLIVSGKISSDSRILFVNDGSADRTWELIDSLCRTDSVFCGISLARNFGHQCALLAGLHTAPGDAVVSIDADLQDDIRVIEQMVDRFREGFDVVYGVRKERKVDSSFKRITALGFYRLMAALGARTVYNHADFRLMSRRALESLRDYREVNLFLRGIVTLIGYPSTSVFYDRGERFAGETKYPFRKMLAFSLLAITAFSNQPLRWITFAALSGMGVVALIFAWVAWTTVMRRIVPGWASILLPMLFIGFLNLLAIGILGEYMARIFDELKARPRYIIATLNNLEDRAVATRSSLT